MSVPDTFPMSMVILDQVQQVINIGEYSGGIITKFKDPRDVMIFSDNITVSESAVHVHGLHLSLINGKVSTSDQNLHIGDFSRIDYSVKLAPEIVQNYDSERFSTNFPNIIRFARSAILYLDYNSYATNHLDLMLGEILGRPVAVTVNDGIILSDRLVVDEEQQLIFYNCIIIGRMGGIDPMAQQQRHDLQVTYEHFIMIPISSLKMIFLLGEENF